jgi:hypothetical protein
MRVSRPSTILYTPQRCQSRCRVSPRHVRRPGREAEYTAYARLKLTRDNRQGMIQKGLADTMRELAE